MELVVSGGGGGEKYHYIRFIHGWKRFITDSAIAEELGISVGQYRDILLRHGGYTLYTNFMIFNVESECRDAKEELDKYLIMKRLG